MLIKASSSFENSIISLHLKNKPPCWWLPKSDEENMKIFTTESFMVVSHVAVKGPTLHLKLFGTATFLHSSDIKRFGGFQETKRSLY